MAKKSEFAPKAEKDEDLKRAVELLVLVIKLLKNSPLEPEVAAIQKDPFLKAVVSQEKVKTALDAFEWDPLFFRPPIPVSVLWHIGIPLKRFRFTRLNGDERLAISVTGLSPLQKTGVQLSPGQTPVAGR